MAPELLDMDMEDDEETLPQANEMSDIYAMGCVGLEVSISLTHLGYSSLLTYKLCTLTDAD
jgi:hypothetical protein